jgi:hypothetical protein
LSGLGQSAHAETTGRGRAERRAWRRRGWSGQWRAILGQPATAGRVGDMGGGGDGGAGGGGATYVGSEEGVECGKGKKDKGHI